MELNYLDLLANELRRRIPEDLLPPDSQDLIRLYAVLVRVKGQYVSKSDVHDCWSAWMLARNPNHPAIAPYCDLDTDTQAEDEPFYQAVLDVALGGTT